MRVSILLACGFIAPAFLASEAYAASYICAVGQVYECQGVEGCKRVSTDAINLSEFMVLDTEKKQLTSASLGEAAKTEDIEGMSTTDKNIFLYGTQDVETWNMTVSLENGALAGGITSGPSSFALFGNCTQK
jgi:hypothetical protein